MELFVIAYPALNASDFKRIQDCRKEQDIHFYKIVKPHVTIVFATVADPEHFIPEVQKQSAGMKSFPFTIRCATVNKNAFNESYHTFLVPDEGYSNFVKLHDRLYGDRFSDNLRLDIDFIPHISIANSTDKSICRRLADKWNEEAFALNGIITSLDIISFENNTVITLKKIDLTLP